MPQNNPTPEPKKKDHETYPPTKPKTPVVAGTDGAKDDKINEGQADNYDSTLKPNYPESPAQTATKNKQQ